MADTHHALNWAQTSSLPPASGERQEWGHDLFLGARQRPRVTPEQQAKLFTPFTRLDQLRAKGHGLGLSIVQRIMEKLDGQVGVESADVPGDGSTFSFTLPAA